MSPALPASRPDTRGAAPGAARRAARRAAGRARVLGAALAAAMVLTACSGEADSAPALAGPEPGERIVVEHAQGTLELDATPQTVFSFDWGVTAVLQALDVPVAGVPKSLVPEPFAALVAEPGMLDLGTLHEPDFEAVAAQPADLVIVAGRSAPHQPELARIAPTIDLTVDASDNVAQSAAVALQLGEIFGRQAQAQALVDDLADSIARLRTQAQDAGDALIVLTTGGGLAAFGPGGRFGVLHDELGFAPAAAITEDGRHGQAVSFEFLLETDPAWLFVVDRDAAIGQGGYSARAVLDNEIVRRTRAYRDGRIVHVDPTHWYLAGNGVVSLQRLVDEVAGVLADDAA